MATKLSELMLDMETGDACIEDAYIASAKGKINVSHAIYEAAYKNYELPDDGNFMCYVESAEEGIPSKSAAAATTACSAVANELGAFLDATVATAKKVKDACEKDLKTLIAVGKKVGVGMSNDFESGFAEPLGKAVVSGRRMDLVSKKFIKSRHACKIAKCYTKGMSSVLAAYGISISSDLNGEVRHFTGCGDVRGSVNSIRDVDSKLSDGGRALNIHGADERQTDSIKASDITDLAMAVYTCAHVADAVIKACGGGAKSSAIKMINSFCEDDCRGGKVSRICESINGDIQKYMANLEDIGGAISTGFTDSTYALMETVSK
jgi:hypothetical protein